jgi:hypothetical protein
MPQFDIIIYFNFFILLITYISSLYLIISLFVIPNFWEIIYVRFLKKEQNNYIYFFYTKHLTSLNYFIMFILVSLKIICEIAQTYFKFIFKFDIKNIFISKLVKFFFKFQK